MVMNLLRRVFGGSVPTDVLEKERTLQASGLAKPQITSVQKISPYVAIVEEIHASFARAADEALVEARKILEKPGMSDHHKTLESLGFKQAQGIVEKKAEENEKERAQREAENILYFQQNYPMYKFITRTKIQEICKKYGLVWGGVDKYRGEVPAKNLAEIMKFNQNNIVKVEDGKYLRHSAYSVSEEISYTIYKHNNYSTTFYHEYVTGFDICAPAKDMNLNKTGLVNGRYEDIPDPVVLYPVRGGYLIVTAWGPEASDEYIVNQKMN